jgi:hypothetical protein
MEIRFAIYEMLVRPNAPAISETIGKMIAYLSMALAVSAIRHGQPLLRAFVPNHAATPSGLLAKP